jgi:HEAT repeat protein
MRSIHSIRLVLAAALVISCAANSFAQTSQAAAADQVKKLVAVLKSDATQKDKADACRELARVGTKEAVAPLAELLADEKLSHMARYGLETIPDPSVDKALREAAGKLQGMQLVGVIGSIGVRRDTKAVSLLAKQLQAPDNFVVQAAARSLGSIGNPAATKALMGNLSQVSAANQLAVCEGLLRCAEAATAKGNRKAALPIYDRLREIQAPQQVRTAALRGAILTRQQDGLTLLAQALHSDDYAMVLAAVRITQEMPGTAVTRLLATELAGPPADRQILLIQTLAKRGDAAALPALFAAARNGQKSIRVEAIRALAMIGDVSAMPVFVQLMGEGDKDITAAAQESLASLPGKEVDAAVMKMLADGPTDRSIAAMDLMVRRRMTSAIPALFATAGGSDAKLRVAAVKKLGELAGPAELPAMLNLLTNAKSPEEMEATEQALGAISLKSTNANSCVGPLEARLAQSQPAQKCALLRVLGAIGGASALHAVRAAVDDSNAEVHATAIRTLGGWNSADAATDLLDVAKAASNPTDKLICLRGYLALAGHGDLPIDQRLTMCRQATPLVQKDDEKKLLLAALGGIVSPATLDLIKPYLEEAATKEEASTGMVNISEKLLQGGDSAKVAPGLIEPLEKVVQTTANPDLAKRATALRDQAKTKAAAK